MCKLHNETELDAHQDVAGLYTVFVKLHSGTGLDAHEEIAGHYTVYMMCKYVNDAMKQSKNT